jgi:hypothetical protein
MLELRYGIKATYYGRREGTCGNTVDSSITVNVKHYIYAANGTSSNNYCTDNAGWHHFFVADEIIFSIKGDITTGAMLGFPMITIWDSTGYYQETEGPLSTTSYANGWSLGEERFEMERSWNVDLRGGAVNAPYDVRFYYQPVERTAIENAATAWMAAYRTCGYSYKYPNPLGFYWFKIIGANYDAAVYDNLHIAGILVSTTLLPVDWLYFDGTTDNKINYLTWGTASENNSSHFNIERSKDAINFEQI